MRKLVQALALFILFIGSSSDTLEALVPAWNSTNTAVTKNQHQKNNNSAQDFANDHIIINRFCNHFINKTDLFSQRKFYSILSLPVFDVAALLPVGTNSGQVPKQLPGYGHLFRYYLF
ncbi:hypothetical protein A8C56_04315 [Niabella ginsenosidivorans]|uniref:Uncharacterized protein n=1 Tax=Niabella ginsenosidivorans TaxID=1176587 RepID=A0A1A9I170_9BACT|nr:hypothetical protein [Niabella ginsenosidivorans]ANH80304.1 hypothetical protein A8C56_04315 [Niabella ginsenosidivorans]